MESLLFEWASALRSAAFYGTIAGMLLWERAAPRRALNHVIAVRWFGNLAIASVGAVLVQWLVPVIAVGVAMAGEEKGWGAFNALAQKGPFAWLLALLALDLGDYLVHRLFHSVPMLWRLHRVHHADLDVDFTTGFRHHPLEVLITVPTKLVVVSLLGAPPTAVLIHELLRQTGDVFNHSNVFIPRPIDRWLRALVVTPDMHRVHHSARQPETDSNYGTLLPWWDRGLGTYRASPDGGHEAMTVGLETFREPRELYLHLMLAQPFRAGGA